MTPETELKKSIKEWAHINHFAHITIGASPFSTPGVADRILMRHGLTVFVEVKVGQNDQSLKQKDFEAICKKAGALYLVVRSIDDLLPLLDKVMLTIKDKTGLDVLRIIHLKGMQWEISQ